MSSTIKIKVKAKEKEGFVQTKLLVKHPMESGLRKDKNGKSIPIHHLKEVKATYQSIVVFLAEMGPGVAKDPFLAFSFKGKKGDTFEVSALDTKNETGIVQVTIK